MIPLLIAGGAALGSAVVNGVSSANAARQLQRGEENARGDIEKYTNKAAGYQQPYYDVGTQNAVKLSDMVNSGAFNVNPYNYQDTQQAPGAYQQTAFNYQQDPGYQFQLQQGMNAVQSGAAAGGGLLSGATLKAMQKYGTGLAAQDYNNAYNRYLQGNNLGLAVNQNAYGQYNTNRNFGASNAMNQYNTQNQQAQQRYGQYSSLAGMGQQAAGNLSNMYNQAGANVANTDIGKANAGAAGTMGVGNAISNGLQTVGNIASTYGAMGGSQGGGMSPQAQGVALSNMGFTSNNGGQSWQWSNPQSTSVYQSPVAQTQQPGYSNQWGEPPNYDPQYYYTNGGWSK